MRTCRDSKQTRTEGGRGGNNDNLPLCQLFDHAHLCSRLGMSGFVNNRELR